MLHKIFKKRSFRRPQKNSHCNNIKVNRENADDSDSFDNNSIGAASPTTTTSNGFSSGPPIATQEEGDICSETDSLRKVTFTEPASASPGKPLSPENGKRETNTDLFDGNVLEAFQTGNISIADFLKSPSPAPKLDGKKKNRSLSDCGINPPTTESWHRMSATTPKKQTLLDRAHSMKTKPKRNPGPVSGRGSGCPEKIVESAAGNDHTKENVCRRDMDTLSVTKPLSSTLTVDHKHRFSASLETLAQEVFGHEFQKYLACASKSTLPQKLPLVSQTSGEISPNSVTTTLTEDPKHSKLDKGALPPESKKLQSLHVDVNLGAGDARLKSSSLSSGVDSSHKLTAQKESSNCKSLDISTIEAVETLAQNLESWSNTADLSNTSYSSINKEDDGIDLQQHMKPIMEGTADNLNLSLECNSKKNSPNDLHPRPIAMSNQLEFVYRRKIGRLSTSDSQYVNVGSFNDGDGDFNASETSIMDIHFPPPPPVEDVKGASLDVDEYDARRCQCLPCRNKQSSACNGGPSYDAGSRFVGATSPDYSFDFTSEVADPLIDSLTSVVPLPEEHDQLVPVLSKALCEIVSEIIASRRKLVRMMKAIEIHQQVLKDQNKQIQKQHKEIAELRKTAYALNNFHILSRDSMEDSLAPANLYSHSHESMQNSPVPTNLNTCSRESMIETSTSAQHNLSRLSRGSLENIRTKAPDRKNRQSREMVELNLTLDKLLYQCSALQKTPRIDSEETLESSDNSPRMVFPAHPGVRRAKSCPSRKLKCKTNAIVEDTTT